MTDQTPAKQKAKERYPMEGCELGIPRMIRAAERSGFATCYREEVEPRDRIIQELIDAIEEVRKINADLVRRGPMDTAASHCLRVSKAALSKIKSTYNISPKP